MTLHEAIEKGVLGKDIKARMMRTVPGRLADLIDRLLYGHSQSTRGEIVLPGKPYVGLGKDPALGFNQGVTFITEFEAFEKPVQVRGSAHLPTPFTYWPEYLQQTDPAGGPCPDGLYDDREPENKD